MTLPTGNRPNDHRRAFTLIELILVMAILTVAAAIVTPSLSGFFRARTQEAEARRMMAMIHFGQSRAVSEGMPMVLWIDARNEAYGLQIQAGYADSDPKAEKFAVDPDLKLDVTQGGKQTMTTTSKLPGIHLMPDGTVGPGSVTRVSITGRDGRALLLVQSANGLNYEIQDPNSNNYRNAR